MPSSSGPLVFVVDDEPVIASTLAVILQMHGFSAKFFISPLEALTAARATSPDLLISDVDMPGFSGIDLAIRMKALYPWCKILLFSGQPSTFDLLNSARAQGQEFDLLLKPVPPPELIWEIRKRIDSTCDVVHGRGRNDRRKSWRYRGLGLTLPGQAIRAETNQKLDRRENQFGLCRLGTLL